MELLLTRVVQRDSIKNHQIIIFIFIYLFQKRKIKIKIKPGMIEIAINGGRRCSVEIIIAINENWQTSSENGKGNIVQRKATASYHGHREQSRSEKNNVLIALFLSSLFISFYFP